jgi:hypothetical protein
MFNKLLEFSGAVFVRPFQQPNSGLSAVRHSLLGTISSIGNVKTLIQKKKKLYKIVAQKSE